MSPKIDFISDISSNKMMWTLKVRVVRFWKVADIENADNILSLEMLLQDERGGRIQASLGKSVTNRFQIEIKELGLYYMKNFVVRLNKLKYKTNNHQFKLMFTHRTSVEETVDAHFGMEVFKFRPFEHLINQVNVEDTELFSNYSSCILINLNVLPTLSQTAFYVVIDVIGEIVSYRPIQEHKQGDKSSAFMNVELQDHEYTVAGRYSVRNSWHASKLCINPDLPQVCRIQFQIGKCAWGGFLKYPLNVIILLRKSWLLERLKLKQSETWLSVFRITGNDGRKEKKNSPLMKAEVQTRKDKVQ
ncbi:uncharacterized protein LOC132612851 [Lycium barbarum]|uniref:uncharacterized protein LOC132612851 n=1 Tax=Lycium barbarum TaxID=112863 RepID=UPI00293E4B8B|nr:uncharacterized protein LOC132612851 [Lycium barbarum]